MTSRATHAIMAAKMSEKPTTLLKIENAIATLPALGLCSSQDAALFCFQMMIAAILINAAPKARNNARVERSTIFLLASRMHNFQ